MNDWKSRLGVVYSTSEEYSYQKENAAEAETPPVSKQSLIVSLDKRNRRGKQVTIISGFKGSDEALKDLGRELRSKCGVGGSAKDGEIIIQGDFRQRIVEILSEMGFKSRKI